MIGVANQFPTSEILVALSASLTGKLGFFRAKFIEKDLAGTKIKFYAVRVPMVAELLAMSGPLATALTSLFSSDRGYRAVKQKENRVVDGNNNATQVVSESESPALPLETIKYQEQQKREAVTTLIDVLTGKDSNNILARFVCDSMRDEFPQGAVIQDVLEFWNGLDIDYAMLLVAGALEANAAVIRPFLGKAGLNLRAEAASALSDKLGSLLALKQPASPPVPATTPSISSEPSSSS
jgi:hypothetical protein